MLKLNLGCGAHILPGWQNVDGAPISGATQASLLDLPFGSDSAECAIMFDVIEHLHPTKEAPKALREVLRVLTPGGVLRVSTPDLTKLAAAYLASDMAHHAAASQPAFYGEFPEALKFSAHAFGNHADTTPVGVYDGHQVLYDETALEWLLRSAGFAEVVLQRHRESLSETIRLGVSDRWPATALIMEARKW